MGEGIWGRKRSAKGAEERGQRGRGQWGRSSGKDGERSSGKDGEDKDTGARQPETAKSRLARHEPTRGAGEQAKSSGEKSVAV